MAPLRASTTKSEWLPDDPTAFVPTTLWKLPFITTWDDSRSQNHPTDSAEEANLKTCLLSGNSGQLLPKGQCGEIRRQREGRRRTSLCLGVVFLFSTDRKSN